MDEKNAKDVMKEKLGCGCCADDSAILKAVNNAQAGRIEALERDLLALKEQNRNDLLEKTGLNKRLDDLAADYRALWVQHQNLKSVNDALLHKNDILNNAKANLIRSNHGLQSKVAKQANEIKRLTEELATARSLFHKAKSDKLELHSVVFDKDMALAKLVKENANLKVALDQASKDAKDNFERGKFKGAEELWSSLQWAKDRLKHGDLLFPVYGYYSMAACVDNLTATAFLHKTLDYQEKEAHDIEIGDEVVLISPMGSDDSNYGIVYDINEEPDGSKCYHVFGPVNCVAFGDKAIAEGSIRKTGKHYGNIPFDYIS